MSPRQTAVGCAAPGPSPSEASRETAGLDFLQVEVLYTATKPDEVFTRIVHCAIEESIFAIADAASEGPGDVGWSGLFPESSRAMDAEAGFRVLQALLRGNAAQEVLAPKEHHWLVLWECLDAFCGLFNDSSAKFRRAVFPAAEHRSIRALDFDAIVSAFFWDEDFALPAAAIDRLGTAGREYLGIADEVFGLAHGLAPHADEIRLEEVSDPRWSDEPPPFRLGDRVYPTFVPDE